MGTLHDDYTGPLGVHAKQRQIQILKQQKIIREAEYTIRSYWNLPDNFKGDFPFNDKDFNTNKHYEAINKAKAKLILLGKPYD